MFQDFTITLEIEVCDFKLKNPTFFNHSSTHFRSKSVIFTRNNLKKMINLEFFFFNMFAIVWQNFFIFGVCDGGC